MISQRLYYTENKCAIFIGPPCIFVFVYCCYIVFVFVLAMCKAKLISHNASNCERSREGCGNTKQENDMTQSPAGSHCLETRIRS